MATYTINDKFKTSTDYTGPAPAWMNPSKGIVDPIEAKVECNLMGKLEATAHSIKNCYDFEHKIKPKSKRDYFYALAGMVGFRDVDMVRRISYGKVLKIDYAKFGSIAVSGHAQKKNKFILDACNRFAKANLNKRELILTDSWLITSLVENPETSCLWDKAIANPIKYVILVNENSEECVQNQFPYYQKVYNRIQKMDNEDNKKELVNKLNARNIGPLTFESINHAYKILAEEMQEDALLIRCEGLNEDQIVTRIKEGIKNDQAGKTRTSTKAKSKASKGAGNK